MILFSRFGLQLEATAGVIGISPRKSIVRPKSAGQNGSLLSQDFLADLLMGMLKCKRRLMGFLVDCRCSELLLEMFDGEPGV